MSDDTQVQSRKTVSITLIVLLILVVSALAWYTFKLQKQLEQINEQQSVIQSQLQAQTQKTVPIPASAHAPASVPEPGPEPVAALETSDDEMVTAESGDPEKVISTDEQQPSESQKDEQEPSSAQLQGQEENGTPADRAPFSFNDHDRRAFDAPRWDPYAEIERMQRDMDRMLDRQFKQFNNDPYFQRNFRQSTSAPHIDVQENERQYMVFVNLPGNDEKDISVTLDGQRLTITGKQEYKQQKRDQMGNVIFQERRSGRFQRSITLSEPVYQNEMKTRLDNGVLKIKIPKVDIGQRR